MLYHTCKRAVHISLPCGKSPPMTDLGTRLEAFAAAIDRDYTWIARQCGASRSALWRIRQGVGGVAPAHIEALEHYLAAWLPLLAVMPPVVKRTPQHTSGRGKGRGKNRKDRLPDDVVREIRRLYAGGMMPGRIVAHLGLTKTALAVRSIAKRRSYQDVD